jgi:hypothetical protein
MHRLYFGRELTALEVRDPTIKACEEVAAAHELYADFRQNQQAAFDGHAHIHKSRRTRIGNGKHKDWFIDYQTDRPGTNYPNVIGTLALKSTFNPAEKQFGGWDYGTYLDEPGPTYTQMTIWVPSELDAWRPMDPSPELLAASIVAITNALQIPDSLF